MKAITAKDCSMFLGTRNIYVTLYNNFPGSAELNHEHLLFISRRWQNKNSGWTNHYLFLFLVLEWIISSRTCSLSLKKPPKLPNRKSRIKQVSKHDLFPLHISWQIHTVDVLDKGHQRKKPNIFKNKIYGHL